MKTTTFVQSCSTVTKRFNFLDFVKIIVYYSEKVCSKNENLDASLGNDFLLEMNCSKVQFLLENFINEFIIKLYENKVKNFLEKIEKDYNLLSRIYENQIIVIYYDYLDGF